MMIRYRYENRICYGVLEGREIHRIEGDIYSDYKVTAERIPAEDARLLAPVEPSKVVCVGLNYVDHAKEMNLALPQTPLLFLKPSTSVIGPGDDIIYPQETDRLEFEAELGVVIRKQAKNVPEDEVSDYILGYTCANDVTARDIQLGDGQWTRGKSFDTFCPIGPGIVTDLDAGKQRIELRLNGDVKQRSSTENLIFSVPYLVSFISRMMTLLPGDVIITGTPHGVGPMKPGDEAVVAIGGIGELRNKVVRQEG